MADQSESSADKSEEPTPKRLEKAREDGDTVRSRELNTTAILLTGAVGMLLFGPLLAEQLYARQQRYFILEVEVDAGEHNSSRPLISVDVEYQNMITETLDKMTSAIAVRFSRSPADVKEDRDHETYAKCAVQIANERNIRATALRDMGQIEEAKSLLNKNVLELNEAAIQCKEKNVAHVIPELELSINVNRAQAELVEGGDWNRSRKTMRAVQNEVQSQQTKSSYFESLFGGAKKK